MKVASFSLSRLQLATFALSLCFMPWLRGGRDAAGLVVIFTSLLVGYILSLKLLDSHNFHISKLAAWAIAFAGYGGLSIFWSVNRYMSVVWLLGIGLAIIAAILAQALGGYKGGWAVFRRCYLEFAAIIGVIGIWIFVTSDYDRLTSLFYWANPAATFFLPAVCIAVWRFVKSPSFYNGILAASITTAFVLTFSRAASVVLITTLVVLLAWEKPKKAYWINLLFITLVCLVGVLAIGRARAVIGHSPSPSQVTRFSEAIKGESTSLSDRIYYLRSSFAIWSSRPLFGSGAGTFGALHPQYQYRVISAGTNAHNVYAQWVSELGLAGALLLAGFMLELLKGLHRRVREQPAKRAAVLGLLAMLVHLGLDIGASFPAVLILSAVLIGYLYKPEPLRPKLPLRTHLYWPVAAIMAIGFLPLFGYYKSLDYTANAAEAQDNGDLRQAAGYFQAAHLELIYNPDTLTGEGINEYVMATDGYEPKLNLVFARSRAEAAIKKDPSDAQHWFLLGRVARAQGSDSDATFAYRQALRLDPFNHPLYYTDLSNLFTYEKMFQQAIKLSSDGLSLYTPAVLSNRGQDENLPKEVAKLYISRANAYIRTSQVGLARADLEQALLVDRSNTSAKRIEATLPPKVDDQGYVPNGAGQPLGY